MRRPVPFLPWPQAAALAGALAAMWLPGCATVESPTPVPAPATAAAPATLKVTGSIIHRERSALPPGAEVVVRLLDASGREEVLLAETRFPAGGREVPIPFTLPVDAAKAQPGVSYLLRAQILVGGATRFVTGTRITVQPHAPPAALSVLVVPGENEPSFTQGGAPARVGPPPRQAPGQGPGRRPPTAAP
jgi:putative lipoprotein